MGRLRPWVRNLTNPGSLQVICYPESACFQANSGHNSGNRTANLTDQNGTALATFTYDSMGVPVSVQVGSDPTTAPRYYYVYNSHGDVVALVDASGASVASYRYDAFGQLTAASETFGGATTWTNPYRYDGRDGVRYDGETGLYWMSVRAYDPALGRFLSRDPLGRAPLFFSDQPYVYAGNNPLINDDPSGQRFSADMGQVRAAPAKSSPTRINTAGGKKPKGKERSTGGDREGTKNGEGVPNEAEWGSEDSSHQYTIWLGQIDHPDEGTNYYHVNLHIRGYRSSKDYYNLHIWFKQDDGLSLIWVWKNWVRGISTEEKESEHWEYWWDRLPYSWAADGAASQMISQIQSYTGVHILTSIKGAGGQSLSSALGRALLALAERRYHQRYNA